MHQIETKTIIVDGSPINTLQAGDFTSTPLLFLHGKAFQAKTWQDLGTLKAVVNAGFSLLALDLPGFGKSPEAVIKPENVITGVMEAVEIERAVIVGPSMSGKIALEFALSYPTKVAGLVLIGAVGVKENQDRLKELPSASLIIWGENDQISDPENGRLLNREIPHSRLVIFQDAKHPCYLEQPELWHETLMDFANTVVRQQ